MKKSKKSLVILIMALTFCLSTFVSASAMTTKDSSSKTTTDFSSLTLVNTKTYTVDGVEYQEYFYKPSSKVQALKSLSVSPMSITPEEGDFNIVISKGIVSGRDWFNNVSGYLTYLQTSGIYNASKIGAGFVSNPIAKFFAKTGLDYLYSGLKGTGTAYSTQRTVVKWGQIYHNGSWVDYYRGTQLEVFWGQINYIYAADGTQIYSESLDCCEANGYKPIYVNATSAFRNNNTVYQYALAQYRSNGYWYGDTGSVVVSTPDWLTGVSFNY